MSARPALTLHAINKRLEKYLQTWKAQGLPVGGAIIEGEKIIILTPEAASAEVDPYENWKSEGAA